VFPVPLIGIISDTHGLLRPQAVELLRGADLIVHGGDIGSPEVVEQLSEIAPLVVIRGNIDKKEWAEQFPPTQTVEFAGKRIFVLHNLKELDFDPALAGYDVVISGHSHKPLIREQDGVLYVNPGSAGPRRFKLPISVAKLELGSEGTQAHICEIAV
jgi:putative phosphoesterase